MAVFVVGEVDGVVGVGDVKWSELRILFAFDLERRAILLVAGDKAGNWSKWYKANIPVADDLFDDHLRIPKGETSWRSPWKNYWQSAQSTGQL